MQTTLGMGGQITRGQIPAVNPNTPILSFSSDLCCYPSHFSMVFFWSIGALGFCHHAIFCFSLDVSVVFYFQIH